MSTALQTLQSMSTLAQVDGGGGLGTLLYVAIVFFVIAIVAYLLGARGVAGMTAGLGRTLLIVFLVLAVILILINFLR